LHDFESEPSLLRLGAGGRGTDPSIVVIARLPIAPIGSMHERTALPSICTVQAPHCAMPHPNFVPVRPSKSPTTHSKGMSSGASTDLVSPFISSVAIKSPRPLGDGARRRLSVPSPSF
jgi:hypothetical protein